MRILVYRSHTLVTPWHIAVSVSGLKPRHPSGYAPPWRRFGLQGHFHQEVHQFINILSEDGEAACGHSAEFTRATKTRNRPHGSLAMPS